MSPGGSTLATASAKRRFASSYAGPVVGVERDAIEQVVESGQSTPFEKLS